MGLDKGYIQVYTGDGKGKTTAAFGLALRAAGAGLRVYIGQFIKGMHYAELDALKRFEDLITVTQFGSGCFIHGDPTQKDIDLAQQGLRTMKDVVIAGNHDVVILDEANVAVFFGLFTVQDVLDVMDAKPPHVELVITGRRAPQELIDRADLVTEMHEVKHYYTQGVEARTGIEK
jgi:cob(I)alamin adenosyltransferase